MITITETAYHELAKLLIEKIDGENFFNGAVEYDTDEFYSALKCTLIVCRNECDKIISILPVWWEYVMNLEGGEEWNDFSWQDFDKYLSELIKQQ